MPVYQTKQLLNNLQQQTEQFLNKAINESQMASPSKLLRKRGKNEWSAAQCMEHLNSYGRYYLPAIEKAIVAAEEHNLQATKEFKSGALRNYFTKLMQPKEGKQNKMKSPKDHQPTDDLDTDKVISEFIDQQERLLVLLEKAGNVDLNKTKAPISIAKFMKLQLGDIFNFLIAHNHRHVLQAERALKAPAIKGEDRSATVA